MKKSITPLKMSLLALFIMSTANLIAQTCSINTNVNGFGGTGTASNNIGQSFTACGSGTLSTVRIECSNTSVATVKVVIYAGEGTNGTKLGEGAIIQVGSNRTNQWDLNSLNIKVTSGQKYTAMFLSASGTPAIQYSTSAQYNYYAGGQIINYGAANNDVFFSATITQLNPTLKPAHLATNVSRLTPVTLQFDRAMTIGTGNVIVKNLTSSVNDTITPAEIVINGSLVTFPINSPLEKGAQYEIIVPNTTLKATTGISYEGLAATKWNFTVGNKAITYLSTSTTSPTKNTSIPYNVVFSEKVTGFDISDLQITNGTPGNLTGADSLYSFDITPTGTGKVVVEIPADVTVEGNEKAKDSLYFDNVKPNVLTKNDTIYLDFNGNGSIQTSDINNGTTDNYSVANKITYSLDKSSFTCNNVGANNVTLTVTDEAGNSESSSATVYVRPKKPILVSKNKTIQLTPNGTVTLAADSVNDGSTGYCGFPLTLSLSKNTFNCSNLGTNTIYLKGDDSKGNLDSVAVTVTVQNKVKPKVFTKNITVTLDSATAIATITPAMIDNNSVGNCQGNLTYSLSKSQFGCGEVGEHKVILTVTDIQGNSDTASAMVTVKSMVPDSDILPTDTTVTKGSIVTIKLKTSKIGVNYSLKNNANNNLVGVTQAGNGGELIFNTNSLDTTTTFKVVAQTTTYDGSAALDFDGINDIVTTNVTIPATSKLTIEAWIYPRSTNYDRLISSYNSNANGEFILDTYSGSAQTDNGKGLRFYIRGNNTNPLIAVPNVLTSNAWNHVAATFDSGSMKLYVNGTLVGNTTATFTTLTASNNGIRLGEDFNVGTAEYFNGKMDEVRIWTIAKTATEIQNGMNNCLQGNETGLMTYFKISEKSGTTITDLKAAKTGTLTNMTNPWTLGKLSCVASTCDYQFPQLATVTVKSVVGIEDNSLSNSVSVIPNPVVNELNVVSELEINNIEILSTLGQVVSSGLSTKTNVSNLSSGVYLLKVTTDSGIAYIRFIKQ